MAGFSRLTAVAAPLPLANVDTDKILAAQFIKTISRSGLGSKLFSSLRYDANGKELPEFILNRTPWRETGILIGRDNFGCGSSREHAPWALADFGIRCIIAPTFADIFYNNCFKNFMLPIALDAETVEMLMIDASDPSTCRLKVDLETQTITRSDQSVIHFDLDSDRKFALLNGIDEIEASLKLLPDIQQWEELATIVSPPIPAEIAFL